MPPTIVVIFGKNQLGKSRLEKIEFTARWRIGVERGIRTPGSFWDIGLAVLRLTRLGHLHFSTREVHILFKALLKVLRESVHKPSIG